MDVRQMLDQAIAENVSTGVTGVTRSINNVTFQLPLQRAGRRSAYLG